MIINTGGRTDTVQYFSKWLLKRFEEGYAYSRNPLFPNKVARYDLDPSVVDCVIFCSKNYAPILDDITEITSRFNTYFHYTITAYSKDIEPGVPSIDESIETLKRLSAIVGKQRLVWRYDPVLFTESYTLDVHLSTFDKMAGEITPYVDRCIFSFVEIYKKLLVNMPEIIPFTAEDKNAIAKGLGEIAGKYGLHIQTCATHGDYSQYGIHSASCTTLDALGKANAVEFKSLKHNGMRANCHCIESRDIGAYDTCLNGCRYCYANQNPQKAFDNFHLHNPDSPMLLGELQETDDLHQSRQKSYLKSYGQQMQLF